MEEELIAKLNFNRQAREILNSNLLQHTYLKRIKPSGMVTTKAASLIEMIQIDD